MCGAPHLSVVPSHHLSLLLGLIAEAVYYLWLDRAGLCTAERSGANRLKAAAQVVPPLVTHSTPAGEEGRVGTNSRCLPRMSARTDLLFAPTHTHTSRLPGLQRSSHRVILPRKESKYILDSGSKSQQENEEQRDICCLPTSGVQETSLSCILFGGTAGSYALTGSLC